MTKLRKILLVSWIVIAVAVVIAINFTIGWRPFLGPRKRATTNRQFERTPDRLARGRYLTQGLLGCETCHSPHAWNQHGAPMTTDMELAGQAFQLPGFPGTIAAPNLTPDPETGAAGWTDDQIARAIREGIKHDDTTVFPLMPYMLFRNLSDDDLASVVVYLRSLAPIRNVVPSSKINFPVNYIVRGVPQPVIEPVPGPNNSDAMARGKYLVSLGCGCHSAVEKLPYAGGEALRGPWGDVTSPNITPDPSGISYYTEATFITALRTGYVGARELSSYHALRRVQEPHRRRPEGDVRLFENCASGEAPRRQLAAADLLQAVQGKARGGRSELIATFPLVRMDSVVTGTVPKTVTKNSGAQLLGMPEGRPTQKPERPGS